MLDKLINKKTDVIKSPVVGKSIPLESVSDEVFAGKVLGDGIAFTFGGDTIYSPCDGRIIFIAETKHACAIKMANGTEVLLHVGVDTVNLKGEGFETLISEDAEIKAKEPIIKFDRKYMENQGIDLTLFLIISNTHDRRLTISSSSCVNLESVVIKSRR